MAVNAKMLTSALYKSATTLQHCNFEDAQGPCVSLEIQISIFNKLNIYSYLWDSKTKNISKLKIVTNEIIKNYICEKQVGITKECIWHTHLKFNVQSINQHKQVTLHLIVFKFPPPQWL